MSFITRSILQNLNEYDQAKPALKTKLENDIFERLASSEGIFVSARVRDSVRDKFPERWETERNKIRPYSPLGNEKGKTYLPLLGEDSSRSKEGVVYYIQVREKAKDQFPGSASFFKKEFNNVIGSISSLIKSIPNTVITTNFCKDLDFIILDRGGEMINANISGRSLELPLLLAVFSFLTGKDMLSSVISTGSLNALGISSVDGIEEKCLAAFNAHPEIEKIIVAPNDYLHIPQQIKDVWKIIEASTIGEALSVCFPDYLELINGIKLKGLTGFTFRKIEVEGFTEPGVEFLFHFLEGEQLSTKILREFDSLEIPQTSVFVINNARVNWLASYIAVKAKNKPKIIAVYDPKFTNENGNLLTAVIISSTVSGKAPGDLISYNIQSS